MVQNLQRSFLNKYEKDRFCKCGKLSDMGERYKGH